MGHPTHYLSEFLPSLRDLVPCFSSYPGLTLRLRSGQAGAILWRRFAAGVVVAFAVLFDRQVTVKGSGQECPLHTGIGSFGV